MFLRPQHFQQQDRHLIHWMESRCSGMQPYAWGISHLTLDRELLSQGKIAITTAAGVFPDGTPFNMPDECPTPTPLQVPTQCKNTIVQLAIPIREQSGKEVSSRAEPDALSRYQLRELEARDFHSQMDSPQETIETGDLWTRLRLSSQEQGAFASIPIAKVLEVKADGQVMLDQHIIATCQQCSGAEPLGNMIEELQGLLTHRGEALAKRLGSPGAGGAAEVADFLLLQIVNRYDPLFQHFAELPQLHPESLYQTLIQMVAELSTITRIERRPAKYPPYQHVDLTGTFQPLIEALREALNWVPDFRAIPIPLKEHKYGIRTATVHDTQLFETAAFILAADAQMPADKLRRQLPPQTTIATTEKLKDLVMAHTPGIVLEPLNVAPKQIPYHAGFTYFEFNKHNPLWEELQKTGGIAMHFSGDYPGLKLELWAIKG